MRADVLPLEATLSIRQLLPEDVFASNVIQNAESPYIIVPPVWLNPEHARRLRERLAPQSLIFSFFLEAVNLSALPQLLAHLQAGDGVLILIDQIPKPQQVDILKRIWQADTQGQLKVTFKNSRDWPYEEGVKSLPWFLRDRVQECQHELFFQNELIQFEEKDDAYELPVVKVSLVTQGLVHLERWKEELSFRFWCSPHWVFSCMRVVAGWMAVVSSSLWRLKVPFEYVYWKLMGRYWIVKEVFRRVYWLLYQMYWWLYAAAGWVKSQIWKLKVPFEFIYWQTRNVIWFLRAHVWKLKAPYYFMREQIWKLKMPIYVVKSHVWKLKVPFYIVNSHLWKWELIYWKVRRPLVAFGLWISYPIRKIYWFGHYQYRKRILGEVQP